MEASMSKANEWDLLKRQFNALTQDQSVESIEDILDEQFRRRFVELITQVAQRNTATVYHWPRRPDTRI
jgi:hypothetical protein